MIPSTWIAALVGGGLIGTSAALLLWLSGRIAGISGMVNGAITFSPRDRWRWTFLVGMVLGTSLYEYVFAAAPTPHSPFAPLSMIVGGILVGWGTRMGNGCTSGHGVCGLGRLSGRSLAAVLMFLSSAMLTVFILRHLILS